MVQNARMPSELITQTAIALLGPVAIWLSQSRSVRYQRWACVVGLASQPFWFYALWDGGQWGVAVVAIVCALAWLKGLWVHWIRPRSLGGMDTIALPPDRPKV